MAVHPCKIGYVVAQQLQMSDMASVFLFQVRWIA
jgi:hypothetical protein